MATHVSLIAGLGNPEEKYDRTLHNAGFWFVDELARRASASFKYEKRFDADVCKIQVGPSDVWLVKPQSWMNLSGGPLRGVLDYYRLKPNAMLVAHDEIDLPPGTVRLKQGWRSRRAQRACATPSSIAGQTSCGCDWESVTRVTRTR